MELILTTDVERLGKAGAVVTVKPGFARNFLMPHGLAVPANEGNRRMLEARQRQDHVKAQRLRQEAESLKQKLESNALTLKLTVGEHDTPFGSVTAHDLMEQLAQQGLVVAKHAIQLHEPIKVLGVYDVPVRVHPDVTATLKVWVVKA